MQGKVAAAEPLPQDRNTVIAEAKKKYAQVLKSHIPTEQKLQNMYDITESLRTIGADFAVLAEEDNQQSLGDEDGWVAVAYANTLRRQGWITVAREAYEEVIDEAPIPNNKEQCMRLTEQALENAGVGLEVLAKEGEDVNALRRKGWVEVARAYYDGMMDQSIAIACVNRTHMCPADPSSPEIHRMANAKRCLENVGLDLSALADKEGVTANEVERRGWVNVLERYSMMEQSHKAYGTPNFNQGCLDICMTEIAKLDKEISHGTAAGTNKGILAALRSLLDVAPAAAAEGDDNHPPRRRRPTVTSSASLAAVPAAAASAKGHPPPRRRLTATSAHEAAVQECMAEILRLLHGEVELSHLLPRHRQPTASLQVLTVSATAAEDTVSPPPSPRPTATSASPAAAPDTERQQPSGRGGI